MSLCRMQVTDFRCLRSVVLDLDPRFTLISGGNASGKTSLLEAMYVLGRGRSFRTRRLENLIQYGEERFIVFGEVAAFDRKVSLGVEGSPEGVRAKLASAKVTLAELAPLLPVQIIDPEIHRLIEEGPSRRRRFLDWGVFHVEPRFVGEWQRFQQALRQRNAALKSRETRGLVTVWDSDLVRCGDYVSRARASYIEALAGEAISTTRTLLGMELSIAYRPGWSQTMSFTEALSRSWNDDQESAATQVGPHRGDLVIKLNGRSVKDRISRGQQKLLAAALLMAQVKLFPPSAPVRPTLLLDDPAAELDNERLTGLIAEVSSRSAQLVVTTLHPEFAELGTPGLRYRVEAGEVRLA